MTTARTGGGATARCPDCERDLPLDGFHREASRPNGRNRRCTECRNERNRQHVAKDPARRAETIRRRREANPEKYAAAVRAHKLRSYGIDQSTYDRLLEGQGGVCAVCEQPERPGSDLAVDHDHVTGAVRGLLCRTCNAGIGLLGDDVATLSRAVAYLLDASGA